VNRIARPIRWTLRLEQHLVGFTLCRAIELTAGISTFLIGLRMLNADPQPLSFGDVLLATNLPAIGVAATGFAVAAQALIFVAQRAQALAAGRSETAP
jgi:hypothetical protein